MRDLSELPRKTWTCVFTDIDGTLTSQGKIGPKVYQALWDLFRAGIHVIPVTGRPAGWCEMIARTWPVAGVIGENGAFYFSLKGSEMHRNYLIDESIQNQKDENFKKIIDQVHAEVPGAAVASDQFGRMFDLAIDFAEDVPPLDKSQVQKIVEIFQQHGATAKVSNIHVNGWFGAHDKLSACRVFCEKELGKPFAELIDQIAFIGDSPNDEPMFKEFKYSFAVQNIMEFKQELRHLPAFVTKAHEGEGFVEFAKLIQ